MEAHILFKHLAATWITQQPEQIKALPQLTMLKQQQLEPVAQFAIKLNQLLLRADPMILEEMKLFFLWPRLRHDISCRVHNQGPVSFHAAIHIAQHIESSWN
ncbi:hypothetical protein KP509_18G020500 [Ceratopteris richardii]|uniref:Retrotransposon gag domain-containing protein n=1 Tax=Ceratopteris richardii TaxID=49495 RepID=A0A8T2SPM1_CERRI|nr:hypothetical protein KP509_18G020500 [Ceratopteris richardii]